MPMKVGIHDNLVLAKALKNDKGTLVIGVKQIKEVNPLDRLNASTSNTSFEAPEQDFLLYPPKNVGYQGKKLNSKEVEKEVGNTKDLLNHILELYKTQDQIKWDMFKGTGVTAENYEHKLTDQPTIDKIYNNLADQFISQVTPFTGEKGKKLRAVFPRQSKAKHFPKLRNKYLESQPVFEDQKVPLAASKIKFSDYEIENGLHLSDAIQPAAGPSAADAKAADSFFAK